MNHTPEVVVITGASAGVGRATAQRFAKEGARIGLIARGIDGLEARGRTSKNSAESRLLFPWMSPTPTKSKQLLLRLKLN